MERVVHISRSFEEAEQWDIEQSLALSPDQRLEAARVLRERVFGKDQPDIRAYHAAAG